MLGVNRPIAGLSDAVWGLESERNQAPVAPAVASPAAASGSASTLAAATRSLSEEENMAAAALIGMGLATDPLSLTAAYLSRHEAGPPREDNVPMETDEPAVAQPAIAHSPLALATAIAQPQAADASAQAEALNNAAAAAAPAASKAPASPIRKSVQTCNDAVDLIKNSGGLPLGSSLSILVANDEGLTRLADAIKSVQHLPIGLRLDRQGYAFTSNGLKQLAPLALRSLTIVNAAFIPQDFAALADARWPISLLLAKPKSYTQIIPGYGPNTIVERTPYLQSAISLSALQVLVINDPAISNAEMGAIRAHPNLRILGVTVPVPGLLNAILANPRIQKLTLNGRELRDSNRESEYAFRGLSTHPALQSLAVNYVDTPQLLAEISSSKKIELLQLQLSQNAARAVKYLAIMPSLSQLSLVASEPNHTVLRRVEIVALSKKPLHMLQIHDFKMDESAVSVAVRAQAQRLAVVGENIRFSAADITSLCNNKAVSFLKLGGHLSPADAARLAASPTLTSLSLYLLPSSNDASAVIDIARRVWVATGKPLSNLSISPIGTSKDLWMIA